MGLYLGRGGRNGPRPETVDGQPVWEVQDVIEERLVPGGREYEIEWVGYQETTWEPEEYLEGAPERLANFRMRRG